MMLLGVVTSTGVLVASAQHTQNNEESSQQAPYQLEETLFFVEDTTLKAQILDTPEEIHTFDQNFGDVHRSQMYLSPDRQYFAVTTALRQGRVLTYILNTEGDVVATPRPGSFSSWSPDSSKVLLFLSDLQNPYGTGMRMYYLSISGEYDDFGLPQGVAGAAVSPTDDSLAYILTDQRTNASDLYVRDSGGNERVLIEGGAEGIAWLAWSPDGTKLAFLQSDVYLSAGEQRIRLVDVPTGEVHTISSVAWGYPPVWAPEESHVIFAEQENVYEFSVNDGKLRRVTQFDEGSVSHPSYSMDGQSIVFSRDVNGSKQVWVTREGVDDQLTDGEKAQTHPLLVESGDR